MMNDEWGLLLRSSFLVPHSAFIIALELKGTGSCILPASRYAYFLMNRPGTDAMAIFRKALPKK